MWRNDSTPGKPETGKAEYLNTESQKRGKSEREKAGKPEGREA
jgi:hypothetical protein